MSDLYCALCGSSTFTWDDAGDGRYRRCEGCGSHTFSTQPVSNPPYVDECHDLDTLRLYARDLETEDLMAEEQRLDELVHDPPLEVWG